MVRGKLRITTVIGKHTLLELAKKIMQGYSLPLHLLQHKERQGIQLKILGSSEEILLIHLKKLIDPLRMQMLPMVRITLQSRTHLFKAIINSRCSLLKD